MAHAAYSHLNHAQPGQPLSQGQRWYMRGAMQRQVEIWAGGRINMGNN